MVVTQQCPSAESNLRLWVTSGLQVRHVNVRLPNHTSLAAANNWTSNAILTIVPITALILLDLYYTAINCENVRIYLPHLW